jgi:hypothetical protein
MENKKYKAYLKNGKYAKNYLTSDTLEELIQMIEDNGILIHNYPFHYLDGILSNDKKTENGRICSWGNLEIEKGEHQMTDYTSF